MIIEKVSSTWWSEEAGFFGEHYLTGDDSIEGHLSKEQLSLKKRTSIEIDGVIKLARLEKNESILDMPCGAGRHTLGLAARGYSAVGLDLNSYHLDRARMIAERDSIPSHFIQGDMRNIKFREKFDVVINMFYSFGFFDDEENDQLLVDIKKSLRNSGRFVMHTDVNLARLKSGQYKTCEERNLRSGGKLIISEEFNEEKSRILGCWTIEKNGETNSKYYSVRVYDVEEFIEKCQYAGFSSITAFGDWSGSPYSKNSEEIIFVAE